MFIERFTPQIRRSLVRSRGHVAKIEALPEADNPFTDRRRNNDRRKKNEAISFKDRRQSKDRRKAPNTDEPSENNENLGRNIDISV